MSLSICTQSWSEAVLGKIILDPSLQQNPSFQDIKNINSFG